MHIINDEAIKLVNNNNFRGEVMPQILEFLIYQYRDYMHLLNMKMENIF